MSSWRSEPKRGSFNTGKRNHKKVKKSTSKLDHQGGFVTNKSSVIIVFGPSNRG